MPTRLWLLLWSFFSSPTFELCERSEHKFHNGIRCDRSSQSEDNRARIRAASVEKNIIPAFMVMLGFFLCRYIPSCIIIYIMNLCSSCNCTTIHVFRDLQFIFVLSSSALNPFVEPVRPSPLKVVKRKVNYDKIVKSSCLLSRSFVSIHPFLMYSSFQGKIFLFLFALFSLIAGVKLLLQSCTHEILAKPGFGSQLFRSSFLSFRLFR